MSGPAKVWGCFFCGTAQTRPTDKAGQESGEITGHGGDRADSKIAGGNLAPKTYEEIGIERTQAHRFKAIATSQRHSVAT